MTGFGCGWPSDRDPYDWETFGAAVYMAELLMLRYEEIVLKKS